MFYKTLLVAISLFSFLTGYSQSGNSPYSTVGLGDLSGKGFIHNTGMGGVGVAMPSALYINNLNPAFLPFNNLPLQNKLTAFEFAGSFEYKALKDSKSSEIASNGHLQYISFAFPITRKYGVSVGLQPYSRVSYNFKYNRFVVNTFQNIKYTAEGNGNLSNAYLSQGFQLNDNLYLGLKGAYIFGLISKSTSSQFPQTSPQSSSFILSKKTLTNYKGFQFTPAVGFRKKVVKNIFFNLGGTYTLSSNLDTRNLLIVERLASANSIPNVSDTIYDDAKGKFKLPSEYKMGFSFDKYYNWTIGADFGFQNWSEHKNTASDSSNLKNSFQANLGGQWIPNIGSFGSFLNRISYRFGLGYENTPLFINGQRVKDANLSFGLSLPVSGYSSVNLAFITGKRGKSAQGLISENYFRVNIGLTFNDNWFVRRKYD